MSDSSRMDSLGSEHSVNANLHELAWAEQLWPFMALAASRLPCFLAFLELLALAPGPLAPPLQAMRTNWHLL